MTTDSAQSSFFSRIKRLPGSRLGTRPLAVTLTGYIAWLAISARSLGQLISQPTHLGLRGFLGAGALLLFLLLFALADPPVHSRHARVQRLGCRLAQPAAALIALWGFNEPVLGALLIISTGQLSAVLRLTTVALILLPADVLLFAILRDSLDALDLTVLIGGNISIQCFTALMVATTGKAQAARDEVMRINAELLATRSLLLEGARDEERLRISRELHDLVGHKLTALKLQLRLRARQSAAWGSLSAAPSLRDADDICVTLADELLNDVRGVVSALREGDGIDLHRSLASLVPALPHPQIGLVIEEDAVVPGLQQAHALLRSAQEGITNALRHSGCSQLVVRLSRLGGGVALTVEDDGAARTLPRFGNGLTGLRERLFEVGGTLEVSLLAKHGFRLVAWVPEVGSQGARS
jgi:signal transduction histidine kinase